MGRRGLKRCRGHSHFHLVIEDLWQNDLLQRPLAFIQVDQRNCVGLPKHLCIDAAIQQDHPTMAPVTLWKHSQVSQVSQGTAGRLTQTRGAQQGDVAGSFEASAALAEQARATSSQVHQAQADGNLLWAGPSMN